MMPGFVLTQGAIVTCSHGGAAKALAPNARVEIGGQPVVTEIPDVVSGCPNAAPPGPCATAPWITGATRVTAMGLPLLLADSKAIGVPPGTPVTVVATQFRVQGI
jgi:hypothetical protein